jgi:hypothetical protein
VAVLRWSRCQPGASARPSTGTQRTAALNPVVLRADLADMSDLSRLLDDVYGDGGGGAAAMPAPPDWSSDEALDDTFASWVPGPPADAPAAERAYMVEDDPTDDGAASIGDVFAAFGTEIEEPTASMPDTDESQPPAPSAPVTELWSAGALDVDDALLGVAAEPEPMRKPASFAPAPASLRWMPSDDDILPRGSGAKRRVKAPSPSRFQLARTPAPAPALVPAAADAGVTPAVADETDEPRVRGRKPAPKHAKPKRTGLQLQLKRPTAPSTSGGDDAPAAEPAKRRSFRRR